MPHNRQGRGNAEADQPADNIEEAILRLKVHDNQDRGNVTQLSPYPDRPGEPDCAYYMKTGVCGFGSNCRYNHPAHVGQGAQFSGELPERIGQPDCEFYLKTGTCKYGPTCKYHHPKDRRGAAPVSFNILGLPMRKDEKPCPYYMRNGSCKFGVACKFHHPQPASFGAVLPVTAPIFGSAGSTFVPSSGLHYMGGFPSWSLPRGSYPSSPQLQGPQSYMPVVLPSQGILPAQGWNTYMVHPMSTSSSDLPERPDQPECRFFMNTGTCKYGSDCKYHHPKERIVQLETNAVGPIGLPHRPGQAICSNYSMYGVCKYGQTCKFDHPFGGYSYQYGLSMPGLPTLDSSFWSYQRNLSTAHSYETSPSKPSKLSDWVRKSDTATKKDQDTDRLASEVPTDEAASKPVFSPPSETSRDHAC